MRTIGICLLAGVLLSCGATLPSAGPEVNGTRPPAASLAVPPAGGGTRQTTSPAGAGSTALSIAVVRAEYGLLSAQTAPGATCTASAQLPSGRASTAQGLDTHSADGSGTITWTYRTVSNTTKGTGSYTISCTSGTQSKTATATFTVR